MNLFALKVLTHPFIEIFSFIGGFENKFLIVMKVKIFKTYFKDKGLVWFILNLI
jgi:hypothetical protein